MNDTFEKTEPKQAGMDFSRKADSISLLEHAELQILAGFCSNPDRYKDMKHYVQERKQAHLHKLVEYKFAVGPDKAALIVTGQKELCEKDKAKLERCREEAGEKAHKEATNKNINKAKRMAKAWWETLDE